MNFCFMQHVHALVWILLPVQDALSCSLQLYAMLYPVLPVFALMLTAVGGEHVALLLHRRFTSRMARGVVRLQPRWLNSCC